MDLIREKQKVLVVDDVAENIDILVQTLKNDYNLVAARNGETAIRLSDAKTPPDLILLDVMMPNMDGFTVFRELKSRPRTRNIPVIFLTAMDDEKSEAQGLSLGAVDYITKPFHPSLVQARVRNQLELKCHRDHLEEMVATRTSQLQQANERIKSVSLQTIHCLSRAAEFRDEDTGAHLHRMSHYAAAIARAMGLNEAVAESIIYAAPMHDVGKIGISDGILLKKGKLTEWEFHVMKQHTVIGAEILGNDKAVFLRFAKIIALTHHERWDGTGYPKGLKGRQIPLAGCIAAIADVFDALTSKRPYKVAFSDEEAFTIIERDRDRHFHPDAVDAFFAIKNEILTIKNRYLDDAQLAMPDIGIDAFKAQGIELDPTIFANA